MRNELRSLKAGFGIIVAVALTTLSVGIAAERISTLSSPSHTTVSKGETPRLDASRPRLPRQGKNLLANTHLATLKHWQLRGHAAYDPTISRLPDGSGSARLVTPYPEKNYDQLVSRLIPVDAGKKYAFGFYLRTENGPTYVAAQIAIFDIYGKFIRNVHGTTWSTSADKKFEECILPTTIPPGVHYAQVQVIKMYNTQPNGRVWIDGLYFGEGLGLEQKASDKVAFHGSFVRVDELGNFDIKRNGTWQPFFPIAIYSQVKRKDWTLYSEAGFNVNIWSSVESEIRKAKAATSHFNPDGMMSGLQIAQYTMPQGWAYNDTQDLTKQLQQIFNSELADHLLLYYWDNENHYDQWDVPKRIINTIRKIDPNGRPVYALQGNYGIARVHAAQGLVNVTGAYLGGGVEATGGAGTGGYDDLLVEDRIEGQVNPTSFAQFNGLAASGDLRLRLYNALIIGAKAIGVYMDHYPQAPIENSAWWPDVPALRREIDKLLPIIREPHWTKWQASTDAPGVHIGTRHYSKEGYVILVNQQPVAQTIQVTLTNLPYKPVQVVDVLNGETMEMGYSTFNVTLPRIDIESGTRVLKLVHASTTASSQ